MEVFDRLIGAEHANLSPHEAFEALMAFTSAKHAKIRPKIIRVLFKKLSNDFGRLSTSQIVTLVDLVTNNPDKDLLAKLELNKFLQSRLPNLSVPELVTCYIALSRQNDTSTHKAVEEMIFTNLHMFDLLSLADLFYHQSKLRIANK